MKKKNKSIARQKRNYRIKPCWTTYFPDWNSYEIERGYTVEKRSLNRKKWYFAITFASKESAEFYIESANKGIILGEDLLEI